MSKQVVCMPAVWAPAPETLAVIPASMLSRHYFNQSKYYLKSRHFHQQNTYQARLHYFHDSSFYFSLQASFSSTEHLFNKNSLHTFSSSFSYIMIDFNNPHFHYIACIFVLLHKATPVDKPQLSYMVNKVHKTLSYKKR